MLTEEQEQYLLHKACTHPQEALQTFARALTLREAIYRIFSAGAGERASQRRDLDVIQSFFAESMTHASLLSTAHEFAWEWGTEDEHGKELRSLLWPVAHSGTLYLF